MKTYSSVKEALRSGIIPTFDEPSDTPRRRRHTVDGQQQQPHPSQQEPPRRSEMICSTKIRLNPDDAPAETLDISNYTMADLARLRREDPFFYYSIPQIHLQSYRMEGLVELDEEMDDDDDDEEEESEEEDSKKGSKETTSSGKDGQEEQQDLKPPSASGQGGQGERVKRSRSRSLSTPPNFLQQAAQQAAASALRQSITLPLRVTKSRRISVEAHPDLVMESILFEGLEGDDDLDVYRDGLNNISLSAVDEDEDEEEDILLRLLGVQSASSSTQEEKKKEDNE